MTLAARPAVEVAAPRRMTPEAATALVGTRVPPAEPNVTEPVVARDADTGAPVYAYLPVTGVAELRRALLGFDEWRETLRAGTGSRNKSRTFGYRPRKPAMHGAEACAQSGLTRDERALHGVLEQWSSHLGDALRAVLPDVVEADLATAAAVLPDWRFGEKEPWTSGVINKTSTLPYHRDAFNFPVWSAMPVLRRGVEGGHLHIPEYDAVIACRDGHALFFPGYQLVHGVTPMRTRTPDAYRISVVYYSLRGLKDCFTYAEETAYGRRRRSERERDIAARLARGERGIPGRTKDSRSAATTKTEGEALTDLIEFARLEKAGGDIEPWAAVLAQLHRSGVLDAEAAAWAVKLYNATDDFGSAFRIYELANTPREWAAAPPGVRAKVGKLPLSQERRNLRGGRILRHLDSYTEQLGALTQLQWLRAGIPGAVGPADRFDALMGHVRAVWGTGRQSAFEWAEFAGKALGLPVAAGDACLWESSGPRQALERLYGNPDPDAAWLDARAAECKTTLAEQGVDLEWWDFETVICDFNVMRKGRYYPGQHLAMLREEIASLPDPWQSRLDTALRAVVPEPWHGIPPGVSKPLRVAYRDTGRIVTPLEVA